MIIRIRERSFIARIAAAWLHKTRMAVTIGHTIHLWNARREELLKNKRWLTHELVHVQQFRHYGFIKFFLFYFLESIKHGYTKNKFEVEARESETADVDAHVIQ